MKRVSIPAAVAFLFGLLWLSSGAVYPAISTGSLPSASTTDGRFVGLAGDGEQTLLAPSKYWIGVPGTETSFKLEIFDGDLGGLWDNHDPLNSVKTEFLLYADPLKSRDPAGKPLIVSTTSQALADNGWSTLYDGPVHASARAPSGNYFYLLVVRWSAPAESAREFNAFKLRGGSQVSLTPGDWAFVGAPINLGADPPLGSPANSYNGQFNWYVFIPPDRTTATFTECDADFRGHSTSPGSPPDDNPDDPRVRIPPDVTYAVFRPDGSLLFNNLAPSGNITCETRSLGITSGGLYRWSWSGVDAHNLIFIKSDYESMTVPETPLLVGSTPTASPTATPSVTRTPTPNATATPTGASTSTPIPPSPTAKPQSTPTPELQSTPTPVAKPSEPVPATTPVAAVAEDASLSPPPSPTSPAPRLLPKAGEDTPEPTLAMAVALVGIAMGLALRIFPRSR